MFAYAKPEQKQESKSAVQKKETEKSVAAPNQTGIPDTMKTRFENLSGFSFDDVRVHYNSDKPAQLQALAYTQGNRGYVAPEQTNIGTQNNIVQRILITDVPNTKDFSNVTDLGVWWAMAAEYHFQKTLPINKPNVENLDPHDYIKSLYDYLPSTDVDEEPIEGVKGLFDDVSINPAKGDRVRVLTHGAPTGSDDLDHPIQVTGSRNDVVEASPVIDNINSKIIGGIRGKKSAKALYCYMGNNAHEGDVPPHKSSIPGIEKGPILSASMSSVSLDKDVMKKALKIAGRDDTWGHIITNKGFWKSINDVSLLKGHFNNYVNDHYNVALLKVLLDNIYNVVYGPYNDFTRYLIKVKAITGKGRSLWS